MAARSFSTDHHEKLERRNLWEHFGKRSELRCRGDETFHPAVASDVHYLFGVQKCVDGDIDSFCARNTEDGNGLGDGSLQIDAHSVAAAQSGVSQSSGESVHAAGDFTVTQPLLSVYKGFFFRPTPGALTQ